MPDTLVIFGTEYNNVAGIIAKDDNDTDQTYVKAPTGNINITTAGTTDVTNYATATVASGSATPASSISGTSATISTSSGTITLTKTNVSSTPQVTAGYISSGTQGTSTVTLSAPVTLQAAATYYPSTSDQTITSPKYLTGTQTIKGVTYSNLTADNIKNGVTVTIGDSADADRIVSVTGTYSGGGGSSKNAQAAQSTTRTSTTTYTELVSLTCASAGTYDVYWTTTRSSTSGTWGSQLFLGSTGYGTAQTGSWSNHVQNIHLTGVQIAANQEVSVRARSRGPNYYAYVGTLAIIQTS